MKDALTQLALLAIVIWAIQFMMKGVLQLGRAYRSFKLKWQGPAVAASLAFAATLAIGSQIEEPALASLAPAIALFISMTAALVSMQTAVKLHLARRALAEQQQQRAEVKH